MTMTANDFDSILPRLDEAIAAHGKINLLKVMGDFEGWSDLDATKADFNFGTHQYHQVEKAAFVGEKKGQGWMIKILGPFTRHTEEHFFNLEQVDEAWSWVEEGNQSNTATLMVKVPSPYHQHYKENSDAPGRCPRWQRLA